MLYDGKGNRIMEMTRISPQDTTFFDVTMPGYTNLFNGERETGWYSSGSTFNSGVVTAATSGYLELPNGGGYVYAELAQSVTVNPEKIVTPALAFLAMTFFDSEKNFLSTVRPTGGTVGIVGNYSPVAIPKGAYYVRVSFGGAYMNKDAEYFVGTAADNEKEILPWEDYYEPGACKSATVKQEHASYTDAPVFKGKTWLLFGDSLTDSCGGHDWLESTSPVGGDGWKDSSERVPWTGYFWASRIARELGLTLDNRAKSGSNINTGSNGSYTDVCGINILDSFLGEIDAGACAPDYITVHFGSNSIISQLGAAGDPAETTTSVCGAVKYFIEKLRIKCPNSVIGFVLPPQSDWGSNSAVKSVAQGRTAIKSVLDLEEYAVPYVDMWTQSGISLDMLTDGIHVSSKQANNLYYHAMRRFLLGL